MDQSLSLVLHAHNAQHSLVRQVARALDLLSELSRQFEILIVDDGSTDQTEEVAHELAREYPQLSVYRHQERQGTDAVIRTGLQHAKGDIVLVQDERLPISYDRVRRLCHATAPPSPQPLEAGLLQRLSAWGTNLKGAQPEAGGLQLIRHRASGIQPSAPPAPLRFSRLRRRSRV